MVPKRYPVATAVMIILGFMESGKNILGMKTLVTQSREVVKDKTFRHENAKKLYVYSDTDNMVGWDIRNVRMTK